MRRAVVVGTGLVLVGGVVCPAVTPSGVEPASAATRAAIPFDFDGDGFADMAIGIKGEDLRGKSNAGAVQVIYGSASGPTAHDQVWHQGRKGVKGALERGDNFGQRLTSGDFDGDGFADLAIGIPSEDIGGKENTGAVQVLYGSAAGLTAAGDQVWHQGSPGVPGTNQDGDYLGYSLEVGDFQGDGYSDLVIGIGAKEVRGKKYAGRVVVLRGSASGLTSAGVQSWDQGSPGLGSQLARYVQFGAHLATGDVNGDDRDDLVVRGDWESGQLHVILGGAKGLTASGSQLFDLADLGMPDHFLGERMITLDDFDGDGRDDLALAAYDSGLTSGFTVALLHGRAGGLRPRPLGPVGQSGSDGTTELAADPQLWDASTDAGDLTGDGNVDLRVGRDVLLGTSKGLGAAAVRWPEWSGRCPKSNALPLSGGTHMWFLCAYQVGTVDGLDRPGIVTGAQGTPDGTPGPAMVWHQDSPGIKGTAEARDNFGSHIG